MLAPMVLRSVLLVVVGLVLGEPALAAETAAPAPAPAPAGEPEAIDPEALETVRAAAEFLAKAERVAFRIDTQWDAVQPDGQKIEFGATRRVLLRRPSHLRFEGERRDGNRGGLLFDGATITVWDADENVYASAPKAADVEAMTDYLVDELDYPVPLRYLVRRDLPERLTVALRSAQFVGDSKLGDAVCDQIALRNDDVDYQLWIAQGPRRVFRRVVISYRLDDGWPQFRADLSDWNFEPAVDDAKFRFAPPDGAEKIPFAPRSRRARQSEEEQ
jgi:hypothetical protein